MTWNMARTLKNVKNEKCTLGPEKWPKKKKQKTHCKMCKMRMHTVGSEIWQEAQKNMENEKSHYRTLIMARNTAKP